MFPYTTSIYQFRKHLRSVNNTYFQIPPPVLSAAIFDGESSPPEMPDSMDVSHSEAPIQLESTSSAPAFQPVLPYDVSQSYQNAAVYHQPVETYQLPTSYEHTTSYQQQGVAFQSASTYETPSSSSYQPASSEQPVEHMTARERFARRNRQAMESTCYGTDHSTLNALEQAPLSSVDHTSNNAADRSLRTMETTSSSSTNCEIEGAHSSTPVICVESASGNMHTLNEGNSDNRDPYPGGSELNASLAEPSTSNAESTEPVEGYSSAVVVPRKKGSIFKSRGHGSEDNKKRLALYKHKWSDNQEGGASTSQQGTNAAVTESQGNFKLLFSSQFSLQSNVIVNFSRYGAEFLFKRDHLKFL